MHKLLLALAMLGLTGQAAAAADIEPLAMTCNACHGVRGVSAGETIPSIGGLPKTYLQTVMRQWKYDERSSITMGRLVKGLSDDEINALAAYYAKFPWVPVPQPAPAAKLAKGRAVVAADCADCHGPRGGDPDIDAPKINGQWAKYMELELEKYRDKDFTMPHRKMKKAVRARTPAEAAAAARYFAAQGR